MTAVGEGVDSVEVLWMSESLFRIRGEAGYVLALHPRVGLDLGMRLNLYLGSPWFIHVPIGVIGIRGMIGGE